MNAWDGKSRGNTLGYKIFLLLLKYGGLRPAYLLLRPVSWYYIWFVPAARKPILYLYQHRLGFDKRTSRKLFRQNIYRFGQTLLDKFYVLNAQSQPFEVKKEGEYHLNEMVDAGKGGIIVSAHIGNYEMAGQLLKRLETKVNIVMFDGEDQHLKEYLKVSTGPKSFHIIFIRDDNSHIFEMSAALARNELICLHADRHVEGSRTISHDFLGKTAKFPLGPFILASKLRAPVSMVFALKLTDKKYFFTATPPQTFEGRGTSGAEIMLEQYVSLLTEKVKKYPEQWFNYFDFWEDIPD